MKNLITLALLALLALPAGAEESPPTLSFAKPGSGEEVTHYDVELLMDRSQRRTFHIPAQCEEVLAAQAAGAGRWGSRLDRALWDKVANDCSYYEFVRAYQRPVEHDFVSGYDFMNASFSDLPLSAECAEQQPGFAPMPGCPPLPPGFTDFSGLIPFQESHAAALGHDQVCRIENGVFHGYLSEGPAGVHCIPSHFSHDPGFRLISVAYADVNMDGYQDAILRLVPLGRGVSHTPILLPLTRYRADGPLVVPRIAAGFPQPMAAP